MSERERGLGRSARQVTVFLITKHLQTGDKTTKRKHGVVEISSKTWEGTELGERQAASTQLLTFLHYKAGLSRLSLEPIPQTPESLSGERKDLYTRSSDTCFEPQEV